MIMLIITTMKTTMTMMKMMKMIIMIMIMIMMMIVIMTMPSANQYWPVCTDLPEVKNQHAAAVFIHVSHETGRLPSSQHVWTFPKISTPPIPKHPGRHWFNCVSQCFGPMPAKPMKKKHGTLCSTNGVH